ncbi:MAG: YqeG family HAD IIIA-type phosphatase [Cyanobacteria bacterium P01_E01_bin.34]
MARFFLTRWIQLLQPDIVVGGPATDLTLDVFKRLNVKGLVLDIDHTIVPTSRPEATSEVKQWLYVMQETFPIWLVSNNWNSQRIRRIAEGNNLPHISRAGKPSRKSLRKATQEMNLPPQEVAIVGDRIFTDVIGGNRLGMVTVFVDPVEPGSRRPKFSFERTISFLLGINLKKTL